MSKKPRVIYGESSRPEWIDMTEHGIQEPDWNNPADVQRAARQLEAFLRERWPEKYGGAPEPRLEAGPGAGEGRGT